MEIGINAFERFWNRILKQKTRILVNIKAATKAKLRINISSLTATMEASLRSDPWAL